MVTLQLTAHPEVLLVQPEVFGEERGFFMETWNQRVFDQALGFPVQFVQDNHSRSACGVLRGLHYQIVNPQGKLVQVVAGRVFDVAVDMRGSSPRLGQWVGAELNDRKKQALWIPPGFAHGFLVLSEYADVMYKATDYYVPAHERTLAWNDANVGIEWPLDGSGKLPLLSPKDAAAPAWGKCPLFA